VAAEPLPDREDVLRGICERHVLPFAERESSASAAAPESERAVNGFIPRMWTLPPL
jgi:hypothetical protein